MYRGRTGPRTKGGLGSGEHQIEGHAWGQPEQMSPEPEAEGLILPLELREATEEFEIRVCVWATWVARLVKCLSLTSAHVLISQLVGSGLPRALC